VFEGLTYTQELVKKWYAAHLSEKMEGEKLRDAERDRKQGKSGRGFSDLQVEYVEADRPNPKSVFSYSDDHDEDVSAVKNARDGLPTGLKIVSSEPITEKRSVFIGHAVRVTDEKEVPLVVNDLLEDRKIAKAAHPAIFAYRIAKDVGGVAGKVYNTGEPSAPWGYLGSSDLTLLLDYDDDGESQAGARLKHLLEILELENVMVVVTRWYGGTLLGPDRFKHINQAARDALELAGFLDEDKKDGKKAKRK
jgi:putative IMPACT (imprinted ancient) family translation regulator